MPRFLSTLVVSLLLALPAGASALTPSVVGEPPGGRGVFRFPQAVAYSPGAQHVFVGDQHSSIVQQFTRDGAWERDIAFHADAAQPGRIGVVGGVAADRHGHLFVLDSQNDRVQVFAMSSGAWLASFGSRGTTPGRFRLGANTGAGGIAILQPDPSAAAVLYIADQYNHRIQRFTLAQTTPGGERVLPPGARDPSNAAVVPVPTPDRVWGSHGPCCAPDRFSYPQGLAADAALGRLYIADDRNHRVVVSDLEGGYLAQIGNGAEGAAPGQFAFPYDVGVDARQPRQLYVADNINHRVQAFDASSLEFVRTWGSFGHQIGNLRYIRALGALADDPAGGVGVADTAGNHVQVFDPEGRVLRAWGIAGRGPGYVTRPRGVALDRRGALAVADTLDARVALFDPDGTYAGQIGLVGTSAFTYPGRADGQLDRPSGVAFDGAGHLWIADTANDRVAEVGPDGTWLGSTGGFAGPQSVAVAPDGAVYVADTGNDRVRRRDVTTGAWTDVPLGDVALDAPSAVAVAPNGTLYVADATHVYAVAPGGAQPTEVAPPPGRTWNHPGGLAADATSLYVADDTPGASAVLRRVGGGWQTLATDGNGPGDVIAPGGLALAPAGTLFVADSGNNRVLRLDPPGISPPPMHALTVSVDGLDRGSVTSAPEGVTCPTDCIQRYGRGRQVVLTATSRSGWQFAGWSGACSGTAACAVTMDSAVSVGASFTPAPPPPAPPPPAPAPAPAPAVDTAAPRLARLRLVPRTLRRGGRIRLRFIASEPARVLLIVEAARSGRRAGSSCVRPVRANRASPRCTRWVALRGHRMMRVRAGLAQVTLTRRPAGRLLRSGRYRLLLAANDAAGNRAPARAIRFTVVTRAARSAYRPARSATDRPR